MIQFLHYLRMAKYVVNQNILMYINNFTELYNVYVDTEIPKFSYP